MRLRKNLKLLASLRNNSSNDVASSSTCPQPPPRTTIHNHNASSSSSPPPPPLVCKLNRSVWDVDKLSQLEGGQYSLSGAVGSISGTLNSFSKTLVDDDDVVAVHRPPRKNKKGNSSKNYREKIENGGGAVVLPARCSKGDGRGWWCKKEAKQGHSLCEHHLYPRSSNHHHRPHQNDNSDNSCNGNNVAPSRPIQPGIKLSDKPLTPPVPPTLAKAVRRGGKDVKKSSEFNSNPYEFYYYSGFGPKWGKRRGGEGRNAAETNAVAAAEGSN